MAGIDEAVRAGKGDIAAHGAADDGGDDEEVDLARRDGILERLPHRWLADHRNVEHQQDHDRTQDRNEAVEGHARLLGEEDEDRDGRGNDAADARIDTQHRVNAQARTGDIADIKDRATDKHEYGKHPAQAREHGIAQGIGAHAGHAENSPHIELDGNVNEDGQHNRKREGSAHLHGKDRGLGQKSRTDGGGGHEEHGTGHGAEALWRGLILRPRRSGV